MRRRNQPSAVAGHSVLSQQTESTRERIAPVGRLRSIILSRWDPNRAAESSRACKTRAEVAQEEDGATERGRDRDKWTMEVFRNEKENLRSRKVTRPKEFFCVKRVMGRKVNIVSGLKLHTGVFDSTEQKEIVDFVYRLEEKGRDGKFREGTYSAPAKWMRGKGRVTMQFGCNYNYATDRKGNPPGILQHVKAEPMPDLFQTMIRRLLDWDIMPIIPDSCIVNIYQPGDCIPPHIDSHDFVRPFCTISFLSECNILFGSKLKVVSPGEFTGPMSIPLPVGSVLVIDENSADTAKHCVPSVPTKRISITFRKMRRSKRPFDSYDSVDDMGKRRRF